MTRAGTALARFAATHHLPAPVLQFTATGHVQEFVYSADMARRYACRQTWTVEAPHVLWVMLNPGTGETEQRRRNTLERCVTWSRAWGFGGLYLGNVFAERTKSAKQLAPLASVQDDLNEQAVVFLRSLSAQAIVAWGSHGRRFNRAAAVARLLPGALCLGTTRSGEPRHPLYMAASCQPVPWLPAGRV